MDPSSPAHRTDRRGFLAAAGSALVGAALGGPRRLPLRFVVLDGDFVHTRPCFSPSGRELLFMRAPAGPDPEATLLSNRAPWTLWTVPAEGGAPAPFFRHDRIGATRPDWCWRTGRIAISGVRDGRGELWLLDADGTGLLRVPVDPTHEGALFYPSWYPDGDALAVTDYRTHRLLRVEVPGGAVRPLTDPGRVQAGLGSVSPDAGAGNPVAFAGQPPGSAYEATLNSIWVVDGDGRGGARPLLPGPGRMPWWSPDGSRLAFSSERGRRSPGSVLHPRRLPPGIPSIFVVEDPLRADGRGDAPVGVGPLDHVLTFPRWSPDSARLACRATDVRTGRSGIALLEPAP